MHEDGGAAGYLAEFRARGTAIAEACTRCGACFRACPMVAPAGLGEADPEETTAAIVDLVTGGSGNAAAVHWAEVCSGSGNCIEYEVMGGPGQCCGVYQFREGDFANTSRVGFATIDGLAAAGAATVLSWCPSCQLQLGETTLPNYEAHFGARPFDMNPFLVFLADHAEALAGLMKHRVDKRVALHERPVLPQVVAAVKKLLSIVSGAELVELDVPRVGTQANSLAALPDFKRELREREFRAAADAGVTTLATIYHACHREICDMDDGRSFEIVNFMEILGAGLGIASEDLYKRLKLIRDIDDIIAETSPLIAAHGLDLDTVRDALLFEFFPGRG